MADKDIRWQQRFANYKKALLKLKEAVEKYETEGMSEIEKEGMIQRFEYTYELAWNTIKDFYENQGEVSIQGSRDAFRIAFNRRLISSGDIWMKMIDSRKLTVHTYNEKTANTVASDIVETYFEQFMGLQETLEKKMKQ